MARVIPLSGGGIDPGWIVPTALTSLPRDSPNLDFDVPCNAIFKSICNFHLQFDDFAVSETRMSELEELTTGGRHFRLDLAINSSRPF